MKVCTDACVFGAYLDPGGAKRILDIGTGTGLIALMLAQRSTAMIDAVDIDLDAAQQAQANVAASIYSERIKIYHQSIQSFAEQSLANSYDFICSNPPYFENCMRSTDRQRRLARHTDSLSFADLFAAVRKLLTANGRFYVHVPVEFEESLGVAAQDAGFTFTERAAFRHSRHVPPSRVYLGATGATNVILKHDELVLRRDDDKDYDPRVRALLTPYYASLN